MWSKDQWHDTYGEEDEAIELAKQLKVREEKKQTVRIRDPLCQLTGTAHSIEIKKTASSNQVTEITKTSGSHGQPVSQLKGESEMHDKVFNDVADEIYIGSAEEYMT